MATLKGIKNRIASVEKIRKVANALEIVALTRLRRIQQDTIAARHYFNRIRELIFDMASCINFKSHPFLEKDRPIKTIGIIAIFSDKGLCGDFNANIIDRFLEFCSNHKDRKIKAVIIGKKGMRHFKQGKGCEISSSYSSTDKQTLEKGIPDISQTLIEGFLKGDIDEIDLLYSKFRLHLLGEVNIIRLLPFVPDKAELRRGQQYSRDYIYEPGAYAIFEDLVKEYVVNQIHQGMLESRCAEEMSRMLAMKSATDNADEMIERLRLSYHKSRQAQITKELTEVVSAAEA